MTAHSERPQRGYDHSAVYYTSDEEMLAVAVPFLRAGLDAGMPTVVSLSEEQAALVGAALGNPADITFLSTDGLYARPATAIRSYRELMAGYVADGAREIRIFGEIPRSVVTVDWDWWVRYEAAVNYAYDEFPLRSMCGYDTRFVPRPILDDVARTHPFVATPNGQKLTSDHYVDPPSLLATPQPVAEHPLQHLPPLVDLTDPAPAAARRAVLDANRAGLPTDEVENLVLSVSEIVTNALRYGQPPVRVRVWSDEHEVVVTVQDQGRGPDDPFAGLLPVADRTSGGLGLWITHQLCSHVAMGRDDEGFTTRMVARSPRWSPQRQPA